MTNRRSLAALAAVAFLTSGCFEEETKPGNDNAAAPATTPAQTSSSKPLVTPVPDAFVLDLKGIELNRDGKNFTVDATAYCATIDDKYNPSRSDQVAAYTEACRKITQRSLQLRACSREWFIASIPTDNPAIRAAGKKMDAADVPASWLFPIDELRRAAQNHDTLTVHAISDLEAAGNITDRPLACPAEPDSP